MKKIIITLLLVLCSAEGFCYGHLRDLFVKNSSGQDVPSNHYLVHKFLTRDALSYCTYPSPNDWEYPLSDEMLSVYFEAAFREWTHGTADYLEKSGRAEEFKDIILLLNKPFQLINKGQCRREWTEKADIEIVADVQRKDLKDIGAFYERRGQFGGDSMIGIVYTDYKTYHSLREKKKAKVQDYFEQTLADTDHDKLSLEKVIRNNYFSFSIRDWKIIDKERYGYSDYVYGVMLHEVGHGFGLADECFDEHQRFEQRNPLGGKMLWVGHNFDEPYSTPYVGNGIMSYSMNKKRTADDVMGLITILDRLTQTKRIIYPLLSDSRVPEVGAIVNGVYKYPPIKKKRTAFRMHRELFSKGKPHIVHFKIYGKYIFKQYFEPVPGYLKKHKGLTKEQELQRQEVIKMLQTLQ